MKSTIEEIRERFDADVERFSNLETGQEAAPDSRLCMELVAETASAMHPGAARVLDIGCGAGNYSLMLQQKLPTAAFTLVDLSAAMLQRAEARLVEAGATDVETMQDDIRAAEIGDERFDVAVAAATLHHLRDDAEWLWVFGKVFAALKPGGSFWIVDLVEHGNAAAQRVVWDRYGDYLVRLGGEGYRDKVFEYIEAEDTPRPLVWQIDQLRRVGFMDIDVLHKQLCGAAFGGRRPVRAG